jgi:hypothetical protein
MGELFFPKRSFMDALKNTGFSLFIFSDCSKYAVHV